MASLRSSPPPPPPLPPPSHIGAMLNPTWLAAIALFGLQQYQAPAVSCLPRWSWSPKWSSRWLCTSYEIHIYHIYLPFQFKWYKVLCRPTSSRPRLDRRARLQFGQVLFGCCQGLASRFRRSAQIWSQLTFLRKWRFFVTHEGPNWPFRENESFLYPPGPNWPFWESGSFLYLQGPNWPPLIQKPNGTYEGPQLTF